MNANKNKNHMNSDNSFLLGSKESNTLEFRTNYSPYIVKTIAAFLNSEGGTIAIGIQEGTISNKFVGIKDADIIIQRIDNDIKKLDLKALPEDSVLKNDIIKDKMT